MSTFLRPTILKAISQALDNTRAHINSYDFDIAHTEGSLEIKYKYRDGIFLQFIFSNERESYTTTRDTHTLTGGVAQKQVTVSDYSIYGTMAPGKLTTREEFKFYGVDSIKKQVENWVVCIWDDLSADPLVKSINQTREDLNEFLKQFAFDNIPKGDEYYSKQEAEEIKLKLDEIEKTLNEELKKSIEDQEVLKKELTELKKEFDSFRQTTSNLTKKNWVKATLTKLYIWGSKKENQQLLKATANYGKTLIETID